MLRPGQGIWIRMAVIVALAYGGSFVLRGLTAALRDAVAFVSLQAHLPQQEATVRIARLAR